MNFAEVLHFANANPSVASFVGAAVGGLASGLTVFRRKMRKVARAAAREAVAEHEDSCRLRWRDGPAVTPAMGTRATP